MKQILRFALKLAAGLLVGLVLFMPLDNLWERALGSVAARLEPHKLAWQGIQDTGLTGFTLTDFTLKTQQGTLNLSFPKVRVSLGLSPLVEIRVTTGQTLTARFFMDKSATLSGGFDLAALGRPEMSGGVSATGVMNFKNWGGPPISGQLTLSAATLALPGGLAAEKVKASADLADTRLTITSFEAEKPLPVKAQGAVDLVWTNPRASSYSLTGSYSLAGKEQNFQKSGTLEQVPGM